MREARNELRSCELRPHSVTAAYARTTCVTSTNGKSCTGRLYSLDEVVADMDGMMDVPGPAADDDEWSDDGYVDTNQQRGETESGVNIDELGIGGECEVGEAAAESDIPEYSLSVGCNYSCNDATPLELFKMLLTTTFSTRLLNRPTSTPDSISPATISHLGQECTVGPEIHSPMKSC